MYHSKWLEVQCHDNDAKYAKMVLRCVWGWNAGTITSGKIMRTEYSTSKQHSLVKTAFSRTYPSLFNASQFLPGILVIVIAHDIGCSGTCGRRCGLGSCFSGLGSTMCCCFSSLGSTMCGFGCGLLCRLCKWFRHCKSKERERDGRKWKCLLRKKLVI